MDTSLFFALNGLAGRNVWLDHLLVWSATLLPAAMILIIVATWFWPGDPVDRGLRQRLAVYAGLAAIVALAIAHVIGMIWFRQRPFLTLPAHLLTPHAADSSFPSDHAVACFALATPFLLARRRVGWVLLACAIVVGLARVASGLHYPSDVAGGALLGVAVASLIWLARDWIERPVARGLAVAHRCRLA
jgi:undecaprenyl-diphosphatase